MMEKYLVTIKEIGDIENGIQPGTKFSDIEEDWTCPICGLGKDAFEEE